MVQQWYDLACEYIRSIEILDRLIPSRSDVDMQVMKLSRLLSARLERNFSVGSLSRFNLWLVLMPTLSAVYEFACAYIVAVPPRSCKNNRLLLCRKDNIKNTGVSRNVEET